MKLFKELLFTSCFVLSAAAAFGQASGVATISSQPFVLRPPSHPEHASGKSLADQRSLLGQGGYTSARGERPLWEVAPPVKETPLGDIARNIRKEGEPSRHASAVWENCLEKSAKACKTDRD